MKQFDLFMSEPDPLTGNVNQFIDHDINEDMKMLVEMSEEVLIKGASVVNDLSYHKLCKLDAIVRRRLKEFDFDGLCAAILAFVNFIAIQHIHF